MERSRRLYELWSWLVPFRVVAETESLPAASELLRVAPSALSRSVKLLEDRLGVALFERRSHRLILNDPGRRLLASVRTAMRILDDGLVDVIADPGVPTVRIGCAGELLPLVLDALARRSQELAGVVAAMDELADGDAATALLRGVVDVAVIAASPCTDGLAVRPLAALARGVFVRAGCPRPEAVPVDAGFAVPIDRDGAPRDGYPGVVPRRIALRARQGAAVLEAVRAAGLAAVLPRAVGRCAGLVEIASSVELAPLVLSVATRPPVAAADLATRTAAELALALAESSELEVDERHDRRVG